MNFLCWRFSRASGMIVEYDQELLAPIGVVRDRTQLDGREVVVIEGGRAVMLVPKAGSESRCALGVTALERTCEQRSA